MSVGIWTRVSASEYASLMGESGFQAAANIMIAAGALVMFIGFVGCCGAIKENKCFLLLVTAKPLFGFIISHMYGLCLICCSIVANAVVVVFILLLLFVVVFKIFVLNCCNWCCYFCCCGCSVAVFHFYYFCLVWLSCGFYINVMNRRKVLNEIGNIRAYVQDWKGSPDPDFNVTLKANKDFMSWTFSANAKHQIGFQVLSWNLPSLVVLLVLRNSWINMVRAHFPCSNL